MSSLFKIFLTLNSLLLSLLVFFVKEKVTINAWHPFFYNFPNIASYLLYFISILIITWLSVKFINFLDSDNIDAGSISTIDPANDAFLPSYLGYFFVALSVPDFEMFCVVFGLISVFIFYSQISYFNPVFFLFGFNFYYVVNNKNIKALLITKKQLKDPSNVEFKMLKRINNYTFIDVERKK